MGLLSLLTSGEFCDARFVLFFYLYALTDQMTLKRINFHRDEELCRLRQGQSTTMMQVEGQVKTNQEGLTRKDNEIYELRVSLVC